MHRNFCCSILPSPPPPTPVPFPFWLTQAGNLQNEPQVYWPELALGIFFCVDNKEYVTFVNENSCDFLALSWYSPCFSNWHKQTNKAKIMRQPNFCSCTCFQSPAKVPKYHRVLGIEASCWGPVSYSRWRNHLISLFVFMGSCPVPVTWRLTPLTDA